MSLIERVRNANSAPVQTTLDTTEDDALNSAQLALYLRNAVIERLGLTTVAELISQGEERARSEMRAAALSEAYRGPLENLSDEQREHVIQQVIHTFCGLGQIQELLDDPLITEVMVNGCQAIFYEKQGRLYKHDATFESKEQILLVIDKILAPLGRRLDRARPLVNARLANGDRVHAVAEPIALDGPVVTIRKFSRSLFTLDSLVEMKSISAEAAGFLKQAVAERKNIAVVGSTGSGKTTFLNALSCEIPKRERIVTIEDSAELQFTHHPNVVRLEARDASIEGQGEVTIRELVKNALRMRPDRIVVGEVRGEECIDMLQAMNTGHDGSLTTLHAGSPEEALLRLVLMARFGMDLPAELIEEQIATALDLIVMAERRTDGKRWITSITRVVHENHRAVLEPVFKLNQQGTSEQSSATVHNKQDLMRQGQLIRVDSHEADAGKEG